MSRRTSISDRAADPPGEADSAAAPASTPRGREVPAVRRACSALWLLARHPEGLSLSRIARDLEILPSTCLHILRELAAARLLAYDANGKLYRLGSGVLELGRHLTQKNPFVQVAQPHLIRLSREFVVGSSAQERDGEDDLVVVAAASVLPGDMVTPGGRTPLLTAASGLLMAAFGGFDDAELRRRFARVRWQNPPDVDDWLADVRAARRAGHAIDEGRFRRGITAIAAPVFNPDGTVDRAISVTAVSAQLEDASRRNLTRAVEAAAAEITKALR
jgi:DNA-binding IclR family transcriptional regulator